MNQQSQSAPWWMNEWMNGGWTENSFPFSSSYLSRLAPTYCNVYQPFTFIYLPSSHLLYFLPSYLHMLYTLQNRSPRWNLMPTQFVFIHNRVIMGFQCMVCWWLLVSLNLRHSTFEPASFSKEKLGHEYMAPRQCPKLAYQGKKNAWMCTWKVLCLPLCQVCGEVFFHNLGEWYCGGERKREREREDQMIPIMHVGCNSNYNSSHGLDH
jgi:hypothetical protein